MSPTANPQAFNDHTAAIADHGARITSVEHKQQTLEDKVDKLMFWMLATAAGVATTLFITLAQVAVRLLKG